MKQFETLTTQQLKKRQKIALGLAFFVLFLMTLSMIFGYYLSNQQGSKSTFFMFVLPILCPLAIFPSMYSTRIKKEIKRRESV